MEQRTESLNYSGERARRGAIEKPQVYSPTPHTLRNNTVSPYKLEEAPPDYVEREFSRTIIVGVIWGLITGIILLILSEKIGLSNYFATTGGQTAHCLLWGLVMGGIYGLILAPIYTRSAYTLPIYSLFAFFPVLFFLLTTPLIAVAGFLLQALKFIVGLVIAIVVIYLVYKFFCG